jgi:hypothetical protein
MLFIDCRPVAILHADYLHDTNHSIMLNQADWCNDEVMTTIHTKSLKEATLAAKILIREHC